MRNNLIEKAICYGASLVVILLISTKLVSACQSIVCNNGIESNTCSIDNNAVLAQRYFVLSFLVLAAVSTLYFTQKKKGIYTVIFCFSSVFIPIVLRFSSGNESCDFFATSVAMWLFYGSLSLFIFQVISRIIQTKKFGVKLR